MCPISFMAPNHPEAQNLQLEDEAFFVVEAVEVVEVELVLVLVEVLVLVDVVDEIVVPKVQNLQVFAQ
ncbi:hypothetical protein GPALN_004873 [Globodera pallida]|nr:hypothetical protein GPALN_004873 [Globodera pallida]